MRTRVTELFGIEYPIFAFSHCRDVVAAVSRAGGMGVLGALNFTPEELELELKWIDEHVGGKPYGVDVVMPAKYEGADAGDAQELVTKLQAMIPERHRQFVEDLLAKHGVEPSAEGADKILLGWTDVTARPQVEVAFRHPIALLASALGPPPADVVAEAHQRGIKVAGLASNARHARKQVEVGVDIIVAQGTEAGGHTGDVSTMVLIPEVVDAVGKDTIVLAAGGIGRGSQMAAGMALGADGVWTGSIWLTVDEADTPELAREKLLKATSRDTVRSRSWTGKPARLLRTAWTDAWESEESPGTLPMPMQFMLIADALRRIHRSGDGELVTFPVGQIVGSMNQIKPAAQVVYDLIEEFVDAIERLNKITEG
ncbi:MULTISPECIES: NAD(P)H-dependent flavin oxidoreductase [Thermomonospora]|uniref:2-nitropropane dioxygenase NPD n=1 Tax=Thermomonospora curvata (strain ATCC 19995 / DSM 43183 / JCM 3096 / KCTC 9072 / NBRC 15933 / NCIMB 10081 / Henssen B9) TaxID=471852 RepID=D1AE90_THECD|nr:MULTISPECIES: nitronate monooxygenase family protein [Thermomonospora]ACY99516.1 2-nitropropane dioxygenase NPD [Thermomonospora curvata DSM 43183]PKK12557.1 MAG: nitronate monooxygenase [Thermomonospora sp. CIF 1]